VTPEMKDKLDGIVRKNPVVIFMKGTEMFPRCGFSAAAVEILRQAGASGKITDVNVLEDRELWESVKEYSEWPTIPQVYVGGEFLGGADIARELYETGELEPKIESALRRLEEPGEGYVPGET
jgi:monothiol glutaredoxin